MAISTNTIKKTSVSIFLASTFVLAFIITPYWMVPSTQIKRTIILVLSFVIGGIWTHVSSSCFSINLDMKKLVPFVLIFVSLLVVNLNSLTSVIPWRGDEDYHIFVTLNLVNKFPKIAGGLIPLLIISFVIATLMKPKLGIIIAVIFSLCIMLIHFFWNPLHGIADLLRYPFINYWFYAIPPLVSSLLGTPYHEYLFRIIPFLSSATIAWMVYDKLPNKSNISRFFWGFAIGTMPLLFYYTSIFYLELPALSLMLFVCFNIKDLLNAEYENIKQIPAWYALILIGFIKETTIIFLISFLVTRYLFAYKNYRKNTVKNMSLNSFLAKEIKIVISVMGPISVYLIFRTFITDARGFSPQIPNLWNISLYGIILKSFIEQFGFFLIFFAVGIILLIRQRSYQEAVFLLLVFIGIPLFHLLDNFKFTGYSRFNLFILAPILAGFVVMIKSVENWNKNFYSLIAVSTLSLNLFLSPINLDGTKVPLWGNYLADTSEHYYPYKKALIWLKETNPDDQIIYSGMNYGYKFKFYYKALNWRQNYKIIIIDNDSNQNEALLQVLADANQDGINIVLYQLTNEDLPDKHELSGFIVKRFFRNQAHSLVVFMKTDL